MGKKEKYRDLNPEFDLLLRKIGEKMREKRENMGYSNYEHFAFDHEIARSQYGKYEKGSEDLRLSSLHKVLKAMNVSFAEFFEELEK